jgi:hypothetical protein
MVGILLAGIFFGAAALPYAVLEKRWRWRWQEVESGKISAVSGTALYREAGYVPTYMREAPQPVLLAAYSCLLLGQLLMPGLVLATLGMFIFGLGMVLIPILVTAGKLYRAGLMLLRREPRAAYFASRNAAWWSLACAAAGVVASLVVCLEAFDWTFLLVASFAFTVIIGQALLLLHVTRRYEDALFAPSRMVRLGDHWVSTEAA